MFVPHGFGVVAPYLMVAGADDYVRFLGQAFGAQHVGTSRRPDGSVANAQLRFGDGKDVATIMVGEARPGTATSRVDLMLYVPDAAAALARAVAGGAEEVMAVGDMPYGDRQAGVRDRWGTTWWLSQRLTAEPYAFD